MRKCDIDIFGEDSLAIVEHDVDNKYRVVRLCDNEVLVVGYFEKYNGCIVRTMYTGEKYATGDYVLEVDNGESTEIIHAFID
jgi:hypothetical protein